MKKLILSMILTLMLASSGRVFGSGSNTVFFPVHRSQYIITDTLSALAQNSKLYSYLESIQDQTLIARVNPILYRYMAYYALNGLEITLDLEDFEMITFRYYPSLSAMLGFTEAGKLVVLGSYPAD